MKYDDEYLKTLYNNNNLADFLSLVNIDDVCDPRKKAIIGALKRSIRVLELEFNPIIINTPEHKSTKANQPQEQ